MQSEYEEEENEDAILQDGARLRVPLYLKDGVTPNPRLTPTQRDKAIAARQQNQSLVTDGTSNPMAMHKPGFRYTADANRRALDDAVKNEAYAEVDQRDANAWKGATNRTNLRDQEGAPCTVRSAQFPDDFGSPGTLQMGDDGELVCVPDNLQDARRLDAKQQAYEEYDRIARDAWRSKS